MDSPATAVAEEVDTTQKTGDWWTGSEYNGRRYNETPAVAEVHVAAKAADSQWKSILSAAQIFC